MRRVYPLFRPASILLAFAFLLVVVLARAVTSGLAHIAVVGGCAEHRNVYDTVDSGIDIVRLTMTLISTSL